MKPILCKEHKNHTIQDLNDNYNYKLIKCIHTVCECFDRNECTILYYKYNFTYHLLITAPLHTDEDLSRTGMCLSELYLATNFILISVKCRRCGNFTVRNFLTMVLHAENEVCKNIPTCNEPENFWDD